MFEKYMETLRFIAVQSMFDRDDGIVNIWLSCIAI